jgi:hypothetical protein
MNGRAHQSAVGAKLMRSALGFARCLSLAALLLASLCLPSFSATQQPDPIQFDVFLGYDGIVPEASWFPVVCEIRNNGPSFTATIEVSEMFGAGYNQAQTLREVVELPTGTLKRVVIPVFSTTRNYSSWEVLLLDERGRKRSEQTGLRARKQIASSTPLIGGLPRTPGGMPSFRPGTSDQTQSSSQSEWQPTAARFLAPIFPDNPIVLEGMGSFYLNSEKAIDLRDPQVEALLAWLHGGGHLIVAIEQVSDITAVPWLQKLLPCELKDIKAVPHHSELQTWVRTAYWATNATASPDDSATIIRQRYGVAPGQKRGKRGSSQNPAPGEVDGAATFTEMTDDPAFELATMQVATGTVRDGHIVVSAGEMPLIVTANRGRGQVTTLMFSPEREPMHSWKNLPYFWGRLIEVPPPAMTANMGPQGGWSSDGIFGAMIDTRQVHKLPVEWLLLLLLVYLVVIGPLDQFWLKKIGRPMLTWITFPCYVVAFSLVIYWIGYKLRAGESEWNEVHLVDVLLKGDHAELRGRTYSSVYSPANQRYFLESQQKYATFRGEFAGTFMGGGGQSSEKANVLLTGDNFKAEIFVPVWTSQLFVSDWWQSAPLPLSVTLTNEGDGWRVRVDNRTERTLTNAQLVIDGRIVNVGPLPAGQPKSLLITRNQGMDLRQFVATHSSNFQNASQSRQRAFGSSESGHIDNAPEAAMAASFLAETSGEANRPNYIHNFIMPPGLDLSSAAEHGLAVLLAWDDGYSPAKSLYKFTPRRSHRDTLWRMAVEMK